MATAPHEELYPQLNPQNFRFTEAANIKEFLEREVDRNLTIYKKYKRLQSVLVSIRYFFLIVSVLFNVAGIGSLSKIFQHDLAIYFEAASLGMDLLTMILFFIESKIMKKIEKHDEVHTLAASSLSTIMDNFSKALNDEHISEQELRSFLREQGKYIELRKSIRTKHFHESDSQDLKKQFRDQIHQTVRTN
jgi:hypothetical protein